MTLGARSLVAQLVCPSVRATIRRTRHGPTHATCRQVFTPQRAYHGTARHAVAARGAGWPGSGQQTNSPHDKTPLATKPGGLAKAQFDRERLSAFDMRVLEDSGKDQLGGQGKD